MVMKSMWDVILQNGLFDNEQIKMFIFMLDQQLSQSLVQCGVGLVDVLMCQFLVLLFKKLFDVQDLDGNIVVGDDGLLMGILLVKDMSDVDCVKFIQSFVSQQVVESMDQDGCNKQCCNFNKLVYVEVFQNCLQVDVEMVSKMIGILVKFMLVQVVLEIGWGKKEIVMCDGCLVYNLFGIKVIGNWIGKVVEVIIIEYINGKLQKCVEKFCVYDFYVDVFKDYVNLLCSNLCYEKVLVSVQDVYGFVYGLQCVGYVIDLYYVEKFLCIICQLFLV